MSSVFLKNSFQIFFIFKFSVFSLIGLGSRTPQELKNIISHYVSAHKTPAAKRTEDRRGITAFLIKNAVEALFLCLGRILLLSAKNYLRPQGIGRIATLNQVLVQFCDIRTMKVAFLSEQIKKLSISFSTQKSYKMSVIILTAIFNLSSIFLGRSV